MREQDRRDREGELRMRDAELPEDQQRNWGEQDRRDKEDEQCADIQRNVCTRRDHH